MSQIPKITSITYVKNGVEYIEQCVRSVMNQTLREIEILIVDGGSTDGTVGLLHKLKEEDSRIQILFREGSVGAQFNAALNIARGDYIAVCEGDDYILPDKYEKQYKIANEYQLDVLRACYYQFFNCKNEEYRNRVELGVAKEKYNRLIELRENDDFFLSLGVNGFWNGLYARKFLIENNITMNETKGAAYQDISFSFLCQLYARKVWFMEEALHCYRIDNPNASVNSTKCIDMHINEYDLLAKHLKKIKKWDDFQQMFLVWEIGSYKHFFNELQVKTKRFDVKRVYDRLISQNIQKSFDNIRMSEKTKKLIMALYDNENNFIDVMLEEDEKNAKMLKYFKNINAMDDNIILFGIGHFGRIIFDFLTLCKKRVVIVDNSINLQERGYKGYKVYKSEECVTLDNNNIIVANVAYAEVICNQLEQLGVEESRIVVCDDEELFLRKIFVGMGEESGFK